MVHPIPQAPPFKEPTHSAPLFQKLQMDNKEIGKSYRHNLTETRTGMTFSVTSKRKEKPDLQRCFNHCYQQMVLWTYQQNVALPDSIHLTYDGAYKCIDLPANFDEPDSLPAPMHPSVVEAHHRLLEREVQLQRLDGGRLDLNLATQRLNQRPRTTCSSMSPIQLASGTPAAMQALEKKEAYIRRPARKPSPYCPWDPAKQPEVGDVVAVEKFRSRKKIKGIPRRVQGVVEAISDSGGRLRVRPTDGGCYTWPVYQALCLPQAYQPRLAASATTTDPVQEPWLYYMPEEGVEDQGVRLAAASRVGSLQQVMKQISHSTDCHRPLFAYPAAGHWMGQVYQGWAPGRPSYTVR